MSLVVPSFSGGNLLQASGSGGTAPAAEATSAGTASTVQPFAQRLVQTMNGTTGTAVTVPQTGSLVSLLQGLLAAVQSGGEEASGADSTGHADLMKSLENDMEQLDESLDADPALLAALQGWLLQAAQLLSGAQVSGQGAADEAAESVMLSPLAQNPETIRFAVQDELNGLVTMLQKAAVEGDKALAGSGAELLNQFSAIMTEAAAPESKAKSKGLSHSDPTALLPVKNNAAAESGGKPQTAEKVVPVLVNPSTAATAATTTTAIPAGTAEQSDVSPMALSANAGEEKNLTVLSKTAHAASTGTTAKAEDSMPEVEVTEDSSDVVTAGQLLIREGLAAPLKAELAKVPVSQFAQQMDTFISGKLEIVSKGGIAEATITLFPENLGQVDVKITMQNGNLIAQFATVHSGAKEMLEQQMSQLRTALQAQGIQVEKLEVTQSTALFSQFNDQQGRQQNSGGQQNRNSRDRREDIEDAVLAAELNGEFKEWAANNRQEMWNQSGGFSAKA
ncbi:flagellar hook-length control protein [compost metagenome]